MCRECVARSPSRLRLYFLVYETSQENLIMRYSVTAEVQEIADTFEKMRYFICYRYQSYILGQQL